jgi:hypothetical protein
LQRCIIVAACFDGLPWAAESRKQPPFLLQVPIPFGLFFFTFFFVPPGWMLSSFDVMMTLPPSEGFSHRLSPGPSRETAVVLELLPHCGSVIVLYICNGAVRYVESESMACDFAENRCAAEPSGPLACACSCSLSLVLPSALTRLFVLVWGYIITGVLPRSCAEPAIVTRTVLIL